MEIARAVPYKIEGGKDIPYQVEEGEEVIKELFDLSYTDYHYFKEKFMDKRTHNDTILYFMTHWHFADRTHELCLRRIRTGADDIISDRQW